MKQMCKEFNAHSAEREINDYIKWGWRVSKMVSYGDRAPYVIVIFEKEA